MKTLINPGKERRSINFMDNIPFSKVKNLNGEEITLYMSLSLQNGNSEMRLADGRDDEVSTGKQPVILWINGAGWRKCDKNLMSSEMQFLAEAGYALACVEYRDTDRGIWPAQLLDVKTAVRFLRANADMYGLDADHIGVIGRSAGGMLASWMAMNTEGFDGEEYKAYSSEVQVAVDMFGPVDVTACYDANAARFSDPAYRWHRPSETHEGALLGGDEETMRQRSFQASCIHYISDKTCPITILHGDQDPIVSISMSDDFYQRLCDHGLADQTDYYVVHNGGHGTREFFQKETKDVILSAFDKVLRNNES